MRINSRLLTTIVFALVLSCVWQWVCLSEEPKNDPLPRIEFEKLEHDFGKNISGPALDYTFTFTNKGDAPLFIEKVKAGWGCTAALVSSRDVPPGGGGTIKVTFDTRHKSGKSRKRIVVHTNDPANRRVNLYVAAELENLIASNPKRLYFDRFSKMEPITRTFSLEGTRLDDVVIKSISVKSPVPEGTYTWVVNDARTQGLKSVTIDVTLHPEKLIPGKFNHTLVVETDIEIAGSIEVRLTGQMTGSLNSEPSRLLFGNYETGVTMEDSLIISDADNRSFKILSATCEDPEIQITMPEDRQAGTTHTVKVIFTPVQDRERMQSKIVIETDLGTQSKMTIDVHGFRKRQPKKITPRAVY